MGTQDRIKNKAALLTLCTFFFLFSVGPVFADDATFTWSANPEPVTGYRLYYKIGGDNSLPFENNSIDLPAGHSPIEVGKVTSYTITGLSPDQTYHFALTAYSGADESQYSTVVTVNPAPAIMKISIK